jgi:hypothetical protein
MVIQSAESVTTALAELPEIAKGVRDVLLEVTLYLRAKRAIKEKLK